MLKRLIIKNINSIDDCEIDFRKGSYKFGEDNVLNDIVNPIAIYGHNGSGKTSIFTSIGYLINLMIEPAESLMPFIVNQFNFNEYMKNPSKERMDLITGTISLFFDLGDDCYEYSISTTSLRQIRYEHLKQNDKYVFDREEASYEYNGKHFEFDNVSFLIPTLRRLASSEINDEVIQTVYGYISSFTFVNLPYINRGAFVISKIFKNVSYYDLLVNHSKEVQSILKNYNEFPTYSIEKKKDHLKVLSDPDSQYVIKLESKDFKGELPFNMISAGMKNQSVLLSILLSAPNNSIIFVDELEQALHPSTIKSFLEVVKKKKIQLVFSSHNTYILQTLRPDQIYFARWNQGFSKYYRLSKIYPNIREINNIEKMYISSVFDEAIKRNEQ